MSEQQSIIDLLRSKEGGSESSVPPINVDSTAPTETNQNSILNILRSKEIEYVNPNPVVQQEPSQKKRIEPLVIPKEATEDQALALQLAPTEAREEVRHYSY